MKQSTTAPNANGNSILKAATLLLSLLIASTAMAQNDTVVVGTGTENIQAPFEPFWEYSYTATIYPSSLISASGNIQSIAYFCHTDIFPVTIDDVHIYLTTTADSAFSYNTQWPNSLTEVFADSNVTLNQAVGWQQLDLQDPFYYTPTMGNLVVVVAKSIASSATNYHSAWNVTPSTNSTLTRYDIFDNGYTDTSNHTTTGMLRNTRPNLRLIFDTLAQAPCLSPTNFRLGRFGDTYAQLDWNSTGSEMEWLATLSDGNMSNIYTCSTNQLFLNALTPATSYTLSLRAICRSGDTSDATSINFHTMCNGLTANDLPIFHDFEDYNATETDSCWYLGGLRQPRIASLQGYGWSSLKLSASTNYDGSNEDGYIVLFNTDSTLAINTLNLAFVANGDIGDYFRLQVGIMDTPNDISTFVPVLDLDSNNAVADNHYLASFANYSGQGRYIAFYTPAPDYNPMYHYNSAIIDSVYLYSNAQWLEVSCDTNRGHVTGGGYHTLGDTVILTATPREGTCYQFSQWSDGNTDNPRQYLFTSSTTLTALFNATTAMTIDTLLRGCEYVAWGDSLFVLSANYTFVVPSHNGCDTQYNLSVTVDQPSHQEFWDTTSGPYQWQDSLYSASGDYSVTYTTLGGCDSTLTLHLTITVGIDNPQTNSTFTLSPNPAHEQITITLSDWDGDKKLQLINALGQTILTRTLTEPVSTLDLSHLPHGIYLLRIGNITRRIAIR